MHVHRKVKKWGRKKRKGKEEEKKGKDKQEKEVELTRHGDLVKPK